MTAVHCVFHAGCPDGFTAYWAVQHWHPGQSVVAHEGRYGEPPPDIEGPASVYVVDFSYPRDVLTGWVDAHPEIEVVVFDHHQTAQADLEGFDHPRVDVVFDMDRSGAGITWDELWYRASDGGRANIAQDIAENVLLIDEKTSTMRPLLLNFVEARDLWRMDEPDVAEVGAFIMTLEHTLDSWYRAMNLGLPTLRQLGAGALAQRRQFCRAVTGFSRLALFDVPDGDGDAWVMPVVNVSYPIGSETAQHLMEHWGTDAAAYYFQRADGTWQYGFRSRGEIDVSVLAQSLGGGGHKHAAGCQGFVSPIHRPIASTVGRVDVSARVERSASDLQTNTANVVVEEVDR